MNFSNWNTLSLSLVPHSAPYVLLIQVSLRHAFSTNHSSVALYLVTLSLALLFTPLKPIKRVFATHMTAEAAWCKK